MRSTKENRYGFHRGAREELPTQIIPKSIYLGDIEGLSNATTWDLPVTLYGEIFHEKSHGFECAVLTHGKLFNVFARQFTGPNTWEFLVEHGIRTTKMLIDPSDGAYHSQSSLEPEIAAAIAGKMRMAIQEFKKIRYSR